MGARAAGDLVALADQLGVDGVNLDIELVPEGAIDGYGTFVAAVVARLKAVRPEAEVSVATMANPTGASLASVAASAGARRVFLMGYDFHWSGSDPGAVAPINRLDGGASLTTAIRQYAAAGVPPGRIILGLPLYGRAWPVVASYRDAPRSGKGVAWLPSKHVAQLSSGKFIPYPDQTEVVEYMAEPTSTGWRAVFYDSPRTLAPKLALARAHGYAGGGFWAIGYERDAPGYLQLMADFIAGRIGPTDSAHPPPDPPDDSACRPRCTGFSSSTPASMGR
jgi:spore germination protein YaaH